MSYHILYNRLFVKVSENEYLPFLEGGDNNCYTAASPRKRARSWHLYRHYTSNGLLASKASIESSLQTSVSEFVESDVSSRTNPVTETERLAITEEITNNLGYYMGVHLRSKRKYSLQTLRSFLVNGMKDAVTIEELKEIGITLMADDGNKVEAIQSTEHFWEIITAHLLVHGKLSSLTIRFNGDYHISYVLKKRNQQKKASQTNITIDQQVDHYFLLKDECGRFLVRSTASGFKYLNYPGWKAKAFRTYNEAQSYLNRSRHKDDFSVYQINENRTFRVRTKRQYKLNPLNHATL